MASLLALKALSTGADKIPDKFFERIPGGFFTPAEKKRAKNAIDNSRARSEHRKSDHRRPSHRDRDRTPPTDYSDYSAYDDTDYEKEYREKQQRRRRAKSLGESSQPEKPVNRGRARERSRGLDGELDDMDRAERGPEFPPPPNSDYRPYNPAEYAPPMGNDYYDRRNSARPEYGYAPQPSAHRGSVAQARYTPGAGYAPSPVPTGGYPPYNPADYASPQPANHSPTYRTPGNAYPSPPPFYRHQSRSQPSLPQYPYPDNQLTYNEPPSTYGSTAPSHRHQHHGEGKHHRAKSADNRARSRSRVTDKVRDRFDNLDTRERGLAASVGGALAGGLAGRAVGHGTLSTIVGAAIGGLGGRELEKRHEKKMASRSASRPRREPSRDGRKGDYSRSRSRDRRRDDRYDDYDSYSDTDSDSYHRSSRKRSSRRSRRDSDDRF